MSATSIMAYAPTGVHDIIVIVELNGSRSDLARITPLLEGAMESEFQSLRVALRKFTGLKMLHFLWDVRRCIELLAGDGEATGQGGLNDLNGIIRRKFAELDGKGMLTSTVVRPGERCDVLL